MKKLTANMTRRQIIALTLAALPAVGCAKQEANNDTSDDISSGEQEANNDASDDIPSEEQPTSSETQIATVAIGETVSTVRNSQPRSTTASQRKRFLVKPQSMR